MAAAPATATTRALNSWHRVQQLALAIVTTLILLGMGGWWAWNCAQAGIAAVESELATEVEAEIVAEMWGGIKATSYVSES